MTARIIPLRDDRLCLWSAFQGCLAAFQHRPNAKTAAIVEAAYIKFVRISCGDEAMQEAIKILPQIIPNLRRCEDKVPANAACRGIAS